MPNMTRLNRAVPGRDPHQFYEYQFTNIQSSMPFSVTAKGGGFFAKHDRVEDLLAGSTPVLRMLPPPHPHFPDFDWEVSAETGEIVSSFYGVRYRPHEHAIDRERRERWRRGHEAEER